MNAIRILAGSCALLLAGALFPTAHAASSNDYYIHFGGNDWIEAGDISLNSQWAAPLAPKAGACGIRLLGSENTQWVSQYGQHFGTANISTNDPILIRLRDLPGCSGSGIDISVDGVAVNLPNASFESFFVYQADNFRWIDNNGNVMQSPGCGAGCQGPGQIKVVQRDSRWNTAIFALENASLSGTRDGGMPQSQREIVYGLKMLKPGQALIELERELTQAIELRRREVLGEDRDVRDREDTALAAVAEASASAQRCEIAWSRGSSDAGTHCERAARLGEAARSSVDVALDMLSD
jgi:hypothetical protein